MSSVRHGVGMGVVALLAALATARADIIHLKGGKVEGLIVERTEDVERLYLVAIPKTWWWGGQGRAW